MYRKGNFLRSHAVNFPSHNGSSLSCWQGFLPPRGWKAKKKQKQIAVYFAHIPRWIVYQYAKGTDLCECQWKGSSRFFCRFVLAKDDDIETREQKIRNEDPFNELSEMSKRWKVPLPGAVPLCFSSASLFDKFPNLLLFPFRQRGETGRWDFSSSWRKKSGKSLKKIGTFSGLSLISCWQGVMGKVTSLDWRSLFFGEMYRFRENRYYIQNKECLINGLCLEYRLNFERGVFPHANTKDRDR